jgi:hypothetical protein
MTKNGMMLSVVAVILAAVYIYKFTDWFNKPTIQIIYQIRPSRNVPNPRNPDQAPVYPVSFNFDGKYELTAVKVVSAEDMTTNKYPTPLWHLVSDSNSMPIKAIIYGYPIKGMKPAVPRARPQPLQPEVEYVLMLEAGKIRAQTNFHTARVSLQ